MKLRHTNLRLTVMGAVLALSTLAAQAAPPKLDAADQKVIKQLEKVLRERVTSPTGQIKMVIQPTDRASEGYFKEVRLQGSPAQVKKLSVTSFFLDAKAVRIDVPYLFAEEKIRTIKSDTKLTAVISEQDLTDMLSTGKHTKAMGLKVKYAGGDKISVTGQLNWTLINGPISGIGRLRMAPGHLVYLDILSLKLRGVEVPQLVKSQFSGRVNPVINYADLPFNPPFKGVKVSGNKATLFTH